MGTLFEQPERLRCAVSESDIDGFVEKIKYLMDKHGYGFESGLKILGHLEEKRKTEILLQDFDSKDEQLAGIGAILQTFVESFADYVDLLKGEDE